MCLRTESRAVADSSATTTRLTLEKAHFTRTIRSHYITISYGNEIFLFYGLTFAFEHAHGQWRWWGRAQKGECERRRLSQMLSTVFRCRRVTASNGRVVCLCRPIISWKLWHIVIIVTRLNLIFSFLSIMMIVDLFSFAFWLSSAASLTN